MDADRFGRILRGLVSRSPVKSMGGIRLKHAGTFLMAESPVPGLVPSMMRVDRWRPVSDTDKDKISSLSEVKEGWIEAYDDVWFGFEGEGMVFPEHVFEYYNLVVIRPHSLDKMVAVDIVSTKLFGGTTTFPMTGSQAETLDIRRDPVWRRKLGRSRAQGGVDRTRSLDEYLRKGEVQDDYRGQA